MIFNLLLKLSRLWRMLRFTRMIMMIISMVIMVIRRAAGPVAAQVIRALAAEGYLGADAASGTTPVEWVSVGEEAP